MILDLELSTPQGTTFNHIIAVYFVRGLSDGATMFPAARLGESAVKPWKTRLESRVMQPISTGLGVWMFLHPLCPCKQLPDVVQVQTCEACISCSRRDRSLYHFDPANVYSNRYRS